MHWWYERDGQRGGPVSEQELLTLVVQGNLTTSTLIWRDGLPAWTQLRDVPSLAGRFPVEPPPLPPPLPPVATAQAVTSTAQPASLERAAASDAEADEYRSSSNRQVLNTLAPPATWYRYFARQIDILLIGLPTVFIASMALALFLPAELTLRMQDTSVATVSAIALLCLFGPLAEATISRVFGNTPGKALFGLRVQTLAGQILSYGEQARRAYGVMVYGLGFYVPFISLFTCVSQFNQVKKQGTAGYDVDLFRVQERALSGTRKFVAISAWVLTFVATIGLSAYDKMEANRIAREKTWTNPVTLVATTIPGGWDVNSESNTQGQSVHIFTRAAEALQVVFAGEDVPQDATLEAYVAAFVQAVKSQMNVSPYGDGAIVAGHGARVHAGELLSPKAPIEITFVKRGDKVWRTVAIRHGGAPSPPSINALRTAVFLSVPKQ